MTKISAALLVLALNTGNVSDAIAQSDADLIVVGRVYTMDHVVPAAQAVAVRQGRIMYIGDTGTAKSYRGASTRWIEPDGGVVLPGLTDAHGHLLNLGRSLSTLGLTGTSSKEQIAAMVSHTQETTPQGQWIRGRGWDQNDWEVEEFPTWQDLAGTEANPVYLRRVDGHAAWVNRAAMDLAGITRDTPDPDGGRIVRDEGGEPTGVFVDNAVRLISGHIPQPDAEELDHWLRSAMAHCNQFGLTGVHDAGTTAAMLESFERLVANSMLTLRVYSMLNSDDDDLIDAHLATGPSVVAGGLVTVRAIKVYADGALGSRGAALLAPYNDEPGNRGLVVTTEEDMAQLCDRALRSGFQVCAHAIGDRGNRMVLDVYEATFRHQAAHGARFRIEHAQVIAPEDFSRFAALGVIPSMQPTHATSDMYWAEARVGAKRLAGAYAWRSLLDAGNPLPFGSDFPVESADPMWGIYAALTRQDHKGWPEGGWYPAQRVTIEEALRGFTVAAAYASYAEDQLGTIAVGKLADLTVLDRDPFASAPGDLLDTKALFTIVGGEVVYAREGLKN